MQATQAAKHPKHEGTYLYGLVAQGVALPRLNGFGSVRSIREGSVQALVSTVPLAEWEPERLATQDAVATAAQRHQEVLQELLDRCTPVPMRLGTILRGDDQVRQFLRRAHSLLVEAIDDLKGRREWGVKLVVDRSILASSARARSGELQSLERRMASAAEGTRFMLEKRRDRLSARLVDEERARLAALVREELGATAEQRVALASRTDCALNDSLLVATAETDTLSAQVEALNTRLEGRGSIQLTGPWPPYSFAPVIDLGEQEQRADD